MKKLIAISVVFALAVGVAFAVDVSGTVFGTVEVLQYDTDSGDATAGGSMGRVRIDASGEAGDGKFGGFIRVQGGDFSVNSAYAYWKPIDQFKLIIGNWDDGIWGKEGVTGWSFNQMPQSDTGIATNPGIWFGNGWGSSFYNFGVPAMHSRYTFFEGFVESGAAMEIRPFDMVGVNLAIPFHRGGDAGDIFKAIIAQVDLNFSFGNIALTFDGGGRSSHNQADDGALFVYFGGSFGDLSLDVGLSYHLALNSGYNPPLGIGVGLKYAAGSFGIKFKATAALGGDDKNIYINTALLPYFTINESISVFLNAGLGMVAPDSGDAWVGWFINPYVRVGAEWGPSFYAGIELGDHGNNGSTDSVITVRVPVAIVVSF